MFACFVVTTSQIVFADDMAVNPVGVVEEVLEFLGQSITHEDEAKASAYKCNGYSVMKLGTTGRPRYYNERMPHRRGTCKTARKSLEKSVEVLS